MFFSRPKLSSGNLPSISQSLCIGDRLTYFHLFYMLDSSLEPLGIMTGCWFAFVTIISVLCSCSCRWIKLSLGFWRWSRNWSCFSARGTRLRVLLPCCRTLWTNCHRFEYTAIEMLSSFRFCVCDHFLVLFCKNIVETPSRSRMKWDTERSCCRRLKSRQSSLPPRFVQPLLAHKQTKSNMLLPWPKLVESIAPSDLLVLQVHELQSSLTGCREELNVYLQQMEEVKKTYESELQKKNEKVNWHTLLGCPPVSPCLSIVSMFAKPPSPCPSGSLPAGEAPQHHSGLPEHRWRERPAAALSAAAADHADGECHSRLWTGGEPESAANTGWFGKENKTSIKYAINYATVCFF